MYGRIDFSTLLSGDANLPAGPPMVIPLSLMPLMHFCHVHLGRAQRYHGPERQVFPFEIILSLGRRCLSGHSPQDRLAAPAEFR